MACSESDSREPSGSEASLSSAAGSADEGRTDGASSAGTGGATNSAGGEGGAAGSVSAGGAPEVGDAGDANGGAGGAAPEATSELPTCPLSFPYLENADAGYWLGADSNFSLQLSPTTSLMTFQDSIVGGARDSSRDGTAFIANSVATIDCEAGAYQIRYHWRREGDGHTAIFDDPGAGGDRLWIQAPWMHEGRLFLTATRVGEGGALGFEEHGMTLARVANPSEPPDQWEVAYFTLTEQRATVGKGVIVHDGHVYLFTPQGFVTLLTRIELSKLVEADISEASLEYLAEDGSWQPGLDLNAARELPIPANTGLTIRYHEASQRFVALYVSTAAWPTSTVAVSFASSLEGPWSDSQGVFEMPEMQPEQPKYDVDNICYGAAEHVDHNPDPDGRLLFTYTCNSLSLQKQMANLDLYVPVVVDIPFPAGP